MNGYASSGSHAVRKKINAPVNLANTTCASLTGAVINVS